MSTPPQSLVVGASGQLGAALLRQLGPSGLAAARRQLSPEWLHLDLEEIAADPSLLDGLFASHNIAAVYCAAGATNVERCESDHAWAAAANHLGPLALARAARAVPFAFFSIELIDTPGRHQAQDNIESQAQTLGTAQANEADLLLVCLAAGEELATEESDLIDQEHPPSVLVGTKNDIKDTLRRFISITTSVITGEGLDNLRQMLVQRAVLHPEPALAPSVSRCKHHVASCLDHLRRAHAIVLEADPPEILALELREALHQLGEMVGAVYTDDLLDRIFSRFCIGK